MSTGSQPGAGRGPPSAHYIHLHGGCAASPCRPASLGFSDSMRSALTVTSVRKCDSVTHCFLKRRGARRHRAPPPASLPSAVNLTRHAMATGTAITPGTDAAPAGAPHPARRPIQHSPRRRPVRTARRREQPAGRTRSEAAQSNSKRQEEGSNRPARASERARWRRRSPTI